MHNNVVAVIGSAQTEFKSHHPDQTFVELVQAATKAALDDARLTPNDIDAVVISMAPTVFMGVTDADRWAIEHLFAANKPVMRIHTGGATGGSALHAAHAHVASGLFKRVLVVGGDRIAETPDAQLVLNLIWDKFYEQDFALNTITQCSLSAQRYMHRYGATEEEFAQVVVRARKNALKNPNAHLKGEISIDDVMASPRIAYPFKRFDICPRSAGACAVVVSDLDTAKQVRSRPAFVTGVSAITHSVHMGDRMGLWSDNEFSDYDGLWRAARHCYEQAGIIDPARDVQVAELYDPFSANQFPQLESLGFCGRGRAAKISQDGGWDIDGGFVAVSPSGGTLCTNPIGVSGLVRVADAAAQVMGEAGDMQVKDVRHAMATAIGGSQQFYTCTLLSADYN
jgi:acetyl-CoA C-acetyltransferase